MTPLTEGELAEVLDHEKYVEKRQQYVDRMVSKGFTIMLPDLNELLLDIDTEANWEFFQKAIKRLIEEYPGGIAWRSWPSKSGLPKRHVSVRMPFDLDDSQRIAFQAVLGSDLVREMLSLFRSQQGDPYPTLLAEKEA